jgi:hypothetical protein
VKLRVTLTTPLGELPATMTVICIIGPNPPDSALGDKRSEGAMLDVPGVINFNHTARQRHHPEQLVPRARSPEAT